MSLSDIIDLITKLPARLSELETTVRTVSAVASSTHTAILGLLGKECEPPEPEPTYVYLLPPDGAMYAKRAYVPVDGSTQVVISTTYPVSRGSWVVAVGGRNTRVTAVMVGNQVQSGITDFGGHVCKVQDPIELGMVVRVNLAG
jgi:hypothetical protein